MILVFIDQADGHIKKSSFEAASYGAALAKNLGTSAEAVICGPTSEDLTTLGAYGITKVHHANSDQLQHVDAQTYTGVLADVVNKTGADTVVFSNNSAARTVAPALGIRLNAGVVMGAVALPETDNGFVVKKTVFSGKAFAKVKINSPKRIVCLNPNSFAITKAEGTATVETVDAGNVSSKIKVTGVNKVEGEIPLSEAAIVVSGGRGLKGPENWHFVTDLAKLLGAATACSRPVADINWRPHHEHVGQTGLAIAPNLYIAIGISGAIQHLAGVNRSKTIVVINKDPEAPFFKAADYGIVGDIFEVMPKLIDAVKELKGVS